jgi:fibronectin type 3 domain-containing protein/predicted phosphodiesterase
VSGDQSVSGTVSVTSGTNPGVIRTVFYLRGAYLLTDFTSPYTFTLQTSRFVDGTALLQMEADMKDGFVPALASVTLNFNNGVVTPPVNNGSFTPKTPSPASGQPLVVAAAGDGADGSPNATNATNIIAGWNPDMVLYLGDVYEKGTATEFRNWYGDNSSFYGRFKAKTNPVVGNHEYEGTAAPGYFDYWDNIPHYYSYDAGGWHFIALDSTSQYNQTDPTSAQYQWLQNDLNHRPAGQCTLAYFHHPVYSVGPQGDTSRMNAIWSLLNTYSVDLVLTGHDHDYQRWLPLDGTGNPNSNGITQFVVGTGGHGVQGFVRTDDRMAVGLDTSPAGIGALKLSLTPTGATYQFNSSTLGPVDSGSVTCAPTAPDTTKPTAPTNLTATPLGSTRIDLGWSAASDNVGVVGYDISRDGAYLASVAGATLTFADTSVAPSSTHTYTVVARDLGNNTSPPSPPATATTPSGGSTPILIDGFESGTLAGWTSVGMVDQSQETYAGSWAARATTTTTAAWAWRNLSSAQTNVYYRIRFKIVSQGANNMYLLKARTATGTSIMGLYLGDTGNTLNYRNDAAAVSVRSTKTVSAGAWHELQLHLVINGTSGQVETWLDGTKVPELSRTDNFGTTAVGRVQMADNSGTRAYDLAMDDVVVDTQFISSAPPADTSAPTAPGSLTATEVSSSRVNLSWSPSVDNVGVVGYDIYRDDGDPLDSLAGNASSYSDNTVDPGATYSYLAKARDAAGNVSAASNVVTVTVPAVAPDAPSGLVATAGNGQVGLSWTAPVLNGGAPITGYRIYRSTTSGAEALTYTLTGTATSYLDTAAPNGSTYYYKVAAVNSAGPSLLSGEASATPTSGTTLPGTPRTLSATGGDTQVTLNWVAPASDGGSAITGYNVYRGTTSGGESLLASLGNVATFLDTGLTNGTTYYYKVTAVNGVGESGDSNEASATPATVPSVPTGLAATAGGGKVDLSWTAPTSTGGSAVTSYKVYRGTSTNAEAAIAIATVTGTAYSDTGLTNGTQYFYKVTAVNAVGESLQSSEANATPVAAATAPGAPTGLTATGSNVTVALSWTAPASNGGSPITSYKVYRGTSTNGESTTAIATVPSGTGYSDTAVTNGIRYFYKVTAVNTVGESALSTEASATPATTPGAPTGLTATAGSGQVSLSWSAPTSNGGSAITGYKLYRSTTSGTEAPLIALGNVTSYTNTGLTAGTTYYYKVSAVNVPGEGALSTEANATPTAAAPLLNEGFEAGSLTGWTATGPIVATATAPHAGAYEARAQCSGAGCFAYRAFASGQTASDVYVKAWVYVAAADNSTTTLFKLRTGSSGSGVSVLGMQLNNKGLLTYRNDAASKTVAGTHAVSLNSWHSITVHLVVGTSGHIDVWLDGAPVTELSRNDSFGTAAIGKLQIGENSSGRTFDVRFDDIAASTSAITP